MGLLDRLFGRNRRDDGRAPGARHGGYAGPATRAARAPREQLPDEQAVARYRYLLRTAPPEQIEQAHAEAFAQLTPDQRQQVLAQLAAAVPAGERPRTDDPETLARVATRAEMRQPGTLERALGGYGPGYGGYGQGGYGQGGYGRGGYGGGYGGPGHGQHDRRQPARHHRRPGHRHRGRRRAVRHRRRRRRPVRRRRRGGLRRGLPGRRRGRRRRLRRRPGRRLRRRRRQRLDGGGGDFGGGDFGGGDFGGGDF